MVETERALRPFGEVTMSAASNPVKVSGMVLIVVVGLLNFHIPHFLIEPTPHASYLLEVALLANVLGAVVAALGIFLGHRWGWLLGIVIAVISVTLYIAQETVGLPGLPKMWWEPSRLVALLVEGLFLVVAGCQVATLGGSTPRG
jgi:hypothetical protein